MIHPYSVTKAPRLVVLMLHIVLAISLVYTGLLRTAERSRANSVALRGRGIAAAVEQVNLTKRLSDATYGKSVQRGLNLRCLMAQSIEKTQYLQIAEFMRDWDNAAVEGWNHVANGQVPFFKHYLDQALNGLGTSSNNLVHHSISHTVGGLIFEDPSDPTEAELDALVTDNESGNFINNGEVSGAQMFSSIDVGNGIFVADRSKTVQPSMKELFGVHDWEQVQTSLQASKKKLTHFQRWSDVAFVQWLDACHSRAGDVRNINYFVRSWITNDETIEIVNKAVVSKFGPLPTIGKWDSGRLSFFPSEEGFDSILGSPNGRGCAWFLISHKADLGEKTITQIDVFTGVLAYTVVGTTYNADVVQASKLFLLFHVRDV